MAMPCTQHISALQNMSPNTTLSRAPFGNRKVKFVPVTRFTSPSTIRGKHKPVYVKEERNYHKLLSGHAEAFFQLNCEPLSESRYPKISIRHNPSTRPLNPVNPPPLTMREGKKLVTIDENVATHAMSAPHTPIKKSYKGSPLDKELPPKPVLHSMDSQERRGSVDALDSDIMNLDTPILEPSSSSDDESSKSFKKAASLDSPSTMGEVETGVAVVVQGETFNMVSANQVRKTKHVKAIPVRTRATGSPMMRVRGLSRINSNGSLDRRAARCSVGPTLRKTSDCHQIIMGPSPHPPRTSSLPKAVKSTVKVSGVSHLGRPTKASIAREAEAQKIFVNPSKILFTKATISKSSLSSADKPSVSKTSLVSSAHTATASKTSQPSSADKPYANNKPFEETDPRLNVSKTSLADSNTTASLVKASKGLKSRFSGMFARRRSSGITVDNKSCSSISDEESLPTPTPAIQTKLSSRLASTNRNSDISKKPPSTGNIRGNKKPSLGEISKKDATPSKRREQEEQRSSAVVQEVVRNDPSPVQHVRDRGNAIGGRGDDGPPTPPRTADGPGSDHYVENEGGHNAQSMGNSMTEDEFDAYLANQLDQAEASLTLALETARNGVTNGESLARVGAILESLGNSIIFSREVLMAGIQLRAATANLIQHTNLRAELAREAVVDAVQQAAGPVQADLDHNETLCDDEGV